MIQIFRTISCKSQFSAYNYGIVYGPKSIADGSPSLIVADFHTAFKLVSSINKTNSSVLTEHCTTKQVMLLLLLRKLHCRYLNKVGILYPRTFSSTGDKYIHGVGTASGGST